MRRVLGVLVLAGVALVARTVRPAPPVWAAQSGSVSGLVQNGSPGGQALGGVEVDLHGFDGSTDQVITSTTSDATGAFHFDNIEINTAAQYSVSVTFDKVPYFSQPFTFASGSQQTADLTVYSTTSSDAAISLDRLSIVIANVDSKQRMLTLVESYHVNNSAPETYVGQLVGSSVQSLRFPLFGGAQALTPEGGFNLSDATSIPSGFALSTPVLPGASTIVFAYQIAYRGHALTLDRTLAYTSALTEVILPGGISVSSPQLSVPSTVSIGGQTLDTIQAENLQAGASVRLQLTGLPISGGSLLPLDSLQTQLLLVGIVILAAALSIAAYRRRAAQQPVADVVAERRQLLRQIARLDDRFEAGRIQKPAYAREREAAKARLRKLLATSNGRQTMGDEQRATSRPETEATGDKERATSNEHRESNEEDPRAGELGSRGKSGEGVTVVGRD
jgi:hypothetical protein